MNVEYQLGIHLQMTLELLLFLPSPVVSLNPSGHCFSLACFLQEQMSARMDSSSATTKGVYLLSGGVMMMMTAQTTVMKKTAVSVLVPTVYHSKH